SALIRRCPWTISLIRLAGTSTALAGWYWLTPSGPRNSSRRISPGCTGAITVSAATVLLLVVVNDLDVFRSGLGPAEAGPPLQVDPDAALPGAVACQLLKPVARRHPKVFQNLRPVQHHELAPGGALSCRVQLPRPLPPPDRLGV